MRTYEVCLGPVLLPNERGGYDLIASGETLTVNAQTCVITASHLILKGPVGETRFIALYNDVRYCRILESIKVNELSAVSSINGGAGAADKGGQDE